MKPNDEILHLLTSVETSVEDLWRQATALDLPTLAALDPVVGNIALKTRQRSLDAARSDALLSLERVTAMVAPAPAPVVALGDNAPILGNCVISERVSPRDLPRRQILEAVVAATSIPVALASFVTGLRAAALSATSLSPGWEQIDSVSEFELLVLRAASELVQIATLFTALASALLDSGIGDADPITVPAVDDLIGELCDRLARFETDVGQFDSLVHRRAAAGFVEVSHVLIVDLRALVIAAEQDVWAALELEIGA